MIDYHVSYAWDLNLKINLCINEALWRRSDVRIETTNISSGARSCCRWDFVVCNAQLILVRNNSFWKHEAIRWRHSICTSEEIVRMSVSGEEVIDVGCSSGGHDDGLK